jgi:iron complex transport system substrate-binding protein
MNCWIESSMVAVSLHRLGRLAVVALQSLLWISCASVDSKLKDPNSPVVHHEVPRYAKGFDWKQLADSTFEITLFNLESDHDTLQVIRWKPRPIQRIASLSTTHVPFIESLNGLYLLKGVGFADRLPNGAAHNLYESGELLNLTTGNELEPEAVFSIQPDLLFVYPFGGKSYDKFLSKGIGCVQVSEYLERHPLGRAEWIRLFGCLMGRQSEADSIFFRIERQYTTLRDSISRYVGNRPVVFAGSMDGDRWAVPPAKSYLATLIYDAGGEYLFQGSSSKGNLILPFESFYLAASTADYWGKIIYEENPISADVITEGDDRLRELPSFKSKQVFACNALATDYHGQALLEPHVLLLDLNRLLSRSASIGSNRYFRPWEFYD